MLEHHGMPVAGRQRFLRRLSVHALVAATLVAVSLVAGILGYREYEHMSWTDAFLNASMILGGMGPVNELRTEAGKIFAAVYALYSGVVFLASAGLVFAPLVHRLLHKFHVETR